jgi:methylmalonyl-CoA mutase
MVMAEQGLQEHAEPGGELRPLQHKIRFVTAASLFDGHDASINIMRRILQTQGAEVIHLGHNRSVGEIVDAAIQEDVQGIAVSSYQGGHMEFFTYMVDLLNQRGAGHIRIFGGGGGVISGEEIQALHGHGIARIFSTEDGSRMGLEGMVAHMMELCDFSVLERSGPSTSQPHATNRIARRISEIELGLQAGSQPSDGCHTPPPAVPVLGITGTGGAGKSSLIDELARRFLDHFPKRSLAILSVDPTKRRTGGALLGDRIRMNAISWSGAEGHPRIFMRSLATRSSNRATSEALVGAIDALKREAFDLIVVETAGIGQSDSEIVDLVDFSLYVMTSEYGAATQLEKIDMLDLADLVVLNKFEKRGAEDALRDIRKQYRRNRRLFDLPESRLPIFPTIASQFNDCGTNALFSALIAGLNQRCGLDWTVPSFPQAGLPVKAPIIPAERSRYLSEIAETVREYKAWVDRMSELARRMGQLLGAAQYARQGAGRSAPRFSQGQQGQLELELDQQQQAGLAEQLEQLASHLRQQLDASCLELLEAWPQAVEAYQQEELITRVRSRELRNQLHTPSLAGLRIAKVALPRYRDPGDILRWILLENLPGAFPFTAGVFPFKRSEEDPTRMFAGEGTPERTNRRFHYLSSGQGAIRLSTAFDSVTLYGEDPHQRPDIFGKIGNSGVSICNPDDMKKLYSGFDLLAPNTSVSMTINGPAPIILAYFFHAAIDQQVERHLRETGRLQEVRESARRRYQQRGLELPSYQGMVFDEANPRCLGLGLLGLCGAEVVEEDVYAAIRARTLATIRGTVQADILKEDQAQNTCIFSTEFALRLMGDVQSFFIANQVRNYYSVSISGYHIAEAGANPITQAALTLANGFTYVEYYLARGMAIDDFAPNLSFFFSNGLDPEYAVIGRVARRIWAIALRDRYAASERAQKLKYHIQTSGRSLHAQEIDFNDIRTSLQALYAIYDNCNSLHTNAFDEAITTPTEDSVRRALAIQLIINRELGLARNENPLQGSFIIEELTELLEEAILSEFVRLSERGGVLSAMETMYQRGKIQEESLHYETLKHSGALPIVGVNTFLRPGSQRTSEAPRELIRSSEEEKQAQIVNLQQFQAFHAEWAGRGLLDLRERARAGANLFEPILAHAPHISLGQFSQALYQVGGQYRRNM